MSYYGEGVIGVPRTKPPTTVTVSDARARLYGLLDEAASSHREILITGKRGNAVLLSEDDWTAIQETLYLLSVPGMRESVREGMKTPVGACAKEPGW
jgi:prevent-host-death family protein